MVAKKAAKKVSKPIKAAKKIEAPKAKTKTQKAVKAVKPVTSKNLNVTKAFGKTDIIKHLTDAIGIAKKEATTVMDTIVHIIESHLGKKGPGEFILPGMAKFREPTVFAAKPARNVIKIKPLKKLKDIVK